MYPLDDLVGVGIVSLNSTAFLILQKTAAGFSFEEAVQEYAALFSLELDHAKADIEGCVERLRELNVLEDDTL